ncbi:MAG: glutamine--fructose-6-phosphate transaminase (isomerizing) [Clostridia bacterium]|nr:glutamine--fructose-6-phosphate transaminase (isomerizing) [Clostridia bacterium]
MCGIVGYIGTQKAAPILLDGLKKLEYRGYDSAGVAVQTSDGVIDIRKEMGRLRILAEKLDGGQVLEGSCGIGHTRWATHGKPDSLNAHPHTNAEQSIVAVHNGIIENYSELKKNLSARGYEFYSETDTEVAIKLVDYYYRGHKDPIKALSEFALRVRGSFALAVLFRDYPDEIYAVRKDSPMIVGIAGGESYLASDVPAILSYTRSVYYVDNLQLCRLGKGTVEFFNLDGERVEKSPVEITWDMKAAEKGGYEHFMLKEMHEQPAVIRDTVNSALQDDNSIDLSETGISEEELKKVRRIIAVGCGSAYHVGVAAQYVIEELAHVPVRVELASEYRYRTPLFEVGDLVIVISQSGETADSLAALRLAKKHGAKTFAVVNVVGSAIAREADFVFYTKAGPEISVATTKAYSAQLAAVYLIALKLAAVRGTVSAERNAELAGALRSLPQKVQTLLDEKEEIKRFAFEAMNKKDVFFIGRGIDYAVSIEGSLKLKEISYVHSEAYAAGELKHGTISLIEDGTLVVGLLTQSGVIEKTVSNMEETRTRGAVLAAFTAERNRKLPAQSDWVFRIPDTDELFAASLAVVPMQLFAYYLSVLRGNDVDNPRHLAKSVTVE